MFIKKAIIAASGLVLVCGASMAFAAVTILKGTGYPSMFVNCTITAQAGSPPNFIISGTPGDPKDFCTGKVITFPVKETASGPVKPADYSLDKGDLSDMFAGNGIDLKLAVNNPQFTLTSFGLKQDNCTKTFTTVNDYNNWVGTNNDTLECKGEQFTAVSS